jgi:cyanophycin synthetase
MASEVLRNAAVDLCFPVVVKPVNLCMGWGVAFAKDEMELGKRLIELTKMVQSSWALVETAVRGREWRVTLLSDGTRAAYERSRFTVVGDGTSTIGDLIKVEQRRRREIVDARQYLRPPSFLSVGEQQDQILADKGLTQASVLPVGESVPLTERPHATLGGLSHDATESLPGTLLEELHAIRSSMGLDRAGLDLIGHSLDRDVYIIEVNGRPSLTYHLEPDTGSPRDIASPLLDMALTRSNSGGAVRTILGPCRLARVAPRRPDNRLTRWLQERLLGPKIEDQELLPPTLGARRGLSSKWPTGYRPNHVAITREEGR